MMLISMEKSLVFAGGCPSSWETFTTGSSSKCYKYFTTAQSPAAAEESCQALGGHLASIHSLEEHNFLIGMALSDTFWIGGVDLNNDGNWGWTDGSSFDYSNWLSNQPNGGEYYIVVGNVQGGGDWRDWTLDASADYVCQLNVGV